MIDSKEKNKEYSAAGTGLASYINTKLKEEPNYVFKADEIILISNTVLLVEMMANGVDPRDEDKVRTILNPENLIFFVAESLAEFMAKSHCDIEWFAKHFNGLNFAGLEMEVKLDD